uniref:non-specific serine/threonine protein kinase n=1 Tax=Pohlia nutans TaxID=140635 RepID=A0A1P8DYW4_9BRYO|nr:leucine-rich repeat receptor-like protein kinase [Pohlia nutans]
MTRTSRVTDYSALYSLLCLLSVLCHFRVGLVEGGLSDDGVALLAVKRSISVDPYRVLASWNERDSDPCSWCGVTCSEESRRVVALHLTGGLGLLGCNENHGASTCQQMSRCSSSSEFFSYGMRACTPDRPDFSPICFRNGTVLDASSGFEGEVPCVLYGLLAPEIGNLSELVVLSLPFNGLSGELPREIGKLKQLETLDLQGNTFSGPIPVEIGELPRLRVLNLANNVLQGSIPVELATSTLLCFLSLAGNTLRDGIPLSIGTLTGLQWLSLASNLLDGEIPSQLAGSCKYLVHLDLSNNYFSGPIPSELANCTQLQSLFLNSNSLVGSIPPEFGRLGSLQNLHLDLNKLSGFLPPALGSCKELSTFVISASQGCTYGLNSTGTPHFMDVHRREGNLFSGSFPQELALLPRMQVIWGPGCGLSGTLPGEWGLCTALEILNLARNSLTGQIPVGLGACKSLVVLDLSSNQLSGTVPVELPISCLVILNVSSNALFGSISATETVCSNPWLLSPNGDTYFRPLTCYGVPVLGPHYVSRTDSEVVYVVHDLSNNALSGPVPVSLVGSSLMKKQTAYALILANNQFSGGFPEHFFSLCKDFQEFAVNLSYNLLLGELPLEVGECETLWYLDVAGNELTGSIPESTGTLSNLVILNLSRNRLRGGIPWQLGGLRNLEGLFLDNNFFSDSMPSSLGNLSKLVMLDLSFNYLDGNIPKELGNLSQLRSLLLDHNSLSGSIPKELSRLTSLEQLNLSFNNLSGQFPIFGNWGGLCSSLVVMGNPYLEPCRVATAPRSMPIMSSPDSDRGMSPYSMPPLPRDAPGPRFNSIVVAAITSGCAIGVVLLVLGLLFQCTKQQYPSLQSVHEGRKVVVTFTNINFHLTYDILVRATSNFCLDNLIGTGGFGATYKAELRPGLVVAVKRLAIGRFQGVQQFDTEIRTLGRIKHPNLVTLIGYYASEDEMFLIYNYFPEGNLETLIHIGERGKRMNWNMRYKIALDLARALAYLHDECVPRVLHRDIKPSNVLLDNNLSAHLSDFGLARLLGDTETHATTDVAGTFGYVAPEYAMTCRLSDKADVYSYGVVLLELLSGKRVLDETFSSYGDGFNIVGWATLLIHNHRPQEVFSAGLWQAGPERELLNVLYLAVECTEESMSVRPPMRQVVERLKSCHPQQQQLQQPTQPLPS